MCLHQQIGSLLLLPSSSDYTSCIHVSSLWEWTSKRKLRHLEGTASSWSAKRRHSERKISCCLQETLLKLLTQQILPSKPFFLGIGSGIHFLFLLQKEPTSLKAGKKKAVSLIYAFWTEKHTTYVYICMNTCLSIFFLMLQLLWRDSGVNLELDGFEWSGITCLPQDLSLVPSTRSMPSNSCKRPIYCGDHQNPQL